MKNLKKILSYILIITLALNIICEKNIKAYGEVDVATEITYLDNEITSSSYLEWQEKFDQEDIYDTGKVMLMPGDTEKNLHVSWYSESSTYPAAMFSSSKDFSNASVFKGNFVNISRSNGNRIYTAANHVPIKNYFQEGKTYYYKVTTNINLSAENVVWSDTYTYQTKSSKSYSVLAVGDTQIGASDNVASDTYYWGRLLKKALSQNDCSFVLSVGDQINYKKDSGDDGLRERQYSGYMYPDEIRSIPIAAAIGNHETKGHDYSYHFYNPNKKDGYGKTNSGCDYYFSRGDALFIVLNSNNRNTSAHRKLMKKAIKNNKDKKWKIVMFHHDIYGSGTCHSNKTSANMRIIFAPLMDEFKIDLVLSGHDHSYCRAYSMLNGTAIKYTGNTMTNPIGTSYVTLGSSSGSKMYGLVANKQFYVKERSNNILPTYSILNVSNSKLTLKTYDINGKKYADDITINKTVEKTDQLAIVKKAKKIKKKNYTAKTYKKLKTALKNFNKAFKPVYTDKGAKKIEKYFRKANDPLSYYGYKAGTTKALASSFSTLLKKTTKTKVTIKPQKFKKLISQIKKAYKNLKKKSMKTRKKF